MIKNKKRKNIFKILICAFTLMLSFTFVLFSSSSVYAYELQDNGTITSENLIDITNSFKKSDTVVVENDTIQFGSVTSNSSVIFQFYSTLNTYYSDIFAFTTEGQFQYFVFRKNSNFNYLRIKSNYDNREIWYDLTGLETSTYYTISARFRNYSSNPTIYNLMLNEGNNYIEYEPFGIWYPNGAMPTELYSAFNNCTVKLYDYYTNTLLLSQSLENLNSSSSAITNSNLSILYNYANERYNNASLNENKDIYYLVFELNSYLNTSLLFRYNNNFIDKKVILNDTLNGLNYEYLTDSGEYNLIANTEYNSFNQIVYYSWYFSDYANLYLSLSTDGYSYSQGYNEAKDKYEVLVDTLNKQYDNLNKNYEALQESYSSLQESFNQSGLGWQSLFFAMADTPFKTVQNMLGFDVLGVNLFGAFIGFITILAIIWVLKKFFK